MQLNAGAPWLLRQLPRPLCLTWEGGRSVCVAIVQDGNLQLLAKAEVQ